MKNEKISIDPLVQIEKALGVPKVDPCMLHDFIWLRDGMRNLNPDEVQVAFFAQVTSDKIILEGVISVMENTYKMQTPYSAIPGLVENPDVLSLSYGK